MSRDIKIAIVYALILLAIGSGATWYFMRPVTAPETAKPGETQADGSKIAPRQPNATAKPKHQIPRGAKVERLMEYEVQGETPPEIAACTSVKCPPVKLDLSLVRLPDSTKRVIGSSQNGEILGSLDIPVEPVTPPPEPKKNAAGVRIDPMKQAIDGIWYERDIWRARVRTEINQPIMDNGKRAKPSVYIGLGGTF